MQNKKPEIRVDAQKGTISVQGMPDRVWGSSGFTINLGEYNSARVDFGMSTDVQENETVNEAFIRCQQFVNAKLTEAKRAIAGKPDNTIRIDGRKTIKR